MDDALFFVFDVVVSRGVAMSGRSPVFNSFKILLCQLHLNAKLCRSVYVFVCQLDSLGHFSSSSWA